MEAIKALLRHDADVSIAAEGGVTALHAAAELGNLELVQLLLKVRFTLLLLNDLAHLACLLCNSELVQLLLEISPKSHLLYDFTIPCDCSAC